MRYSFLGLIAENIMVKKKLKKDIISKKYYILNFIMQNKKQYGPLTCT
jgi:hypothetical protein